MAVLFGFTYAGIMPLYAVLVRENFPLRMMGTVIGGTAMAGSLGMATGPLAGGVIFDTFGSYAWLYIGSGLFGLGAFAIMLTFRPIPAVKPSHTGAGVENVKSLRRRAAACAELQDGKNNDDGEHDKVRASAGVWSGLTGRIDPKAARHFTSVSSGLPFSTM